MKNWLIGKWQDSILRRLLQGWLIQVRYDNRNEIITEILEYLLRSEEKKVPVELLKDLFKNFSKVQRIITNYCFIKKHENSTKEKIISIEVKDKNELFKTLNELIHQQEINRHNLALRFFQFLSILLVVMGMVFGIMQWQANISLSAMQAEIAKRNLEINDLARRPDLSFVVKDFSQRPYTFFSNNQTFAHIDLCIINAGSIPARNISISVAGVKGILSNRTEIDNILPKDFICTKLQTQLFETLNGTVNLDFMIDCDPCNRRVHQELNLTIIT